MKRANRRFSFLRVLVVSALPALCSHHATLSAQPAADMPSLRDELKARRGRLMEKLGNDTIAILWSAPERVYSRDIDYEYGRTAIFST
jgi:hypothetical protein